VHTPYGGAFFNGRRSVKVLISGWGKTEGDPYGLLSGKNSAATNQGPLDNNSAALAYDRAMNTTTERSRSEPLSFAELARQRRATTHFLPDEIPEADITQAFLTAAEAPSGFNSQPWRFLTLRNEANRVALRKAAYNQEKVTEAPLVIVAYGLKEGWEEPLAEIQQEKARRLGLDSKAAEKQTKSASDFIHKMDTSVWLNRHVMIAFTYLMLAFEDLGWDTAPMEGFDPKKVKETFSLPSDVEVIALLAVGRAKDGSQRHPGRLGLDQIVSDEVAGSPWHGRNTRVGA